MKDIHLHAKDDFEMCREDRVWEQLFLDTLCAYFEEEQMLDKRQLLLFRKYWMMEEKLTM